MEKYFILTNSTASLTKRFIVLHSGYSVIKEKSQAVKKTINGGLDVSVGGLFKRHEYMVRVREEESDTDYGTLADLDTFFSYNKPNPDVGIPSNLLTFTDHFGVGFYVYMAGDFAPMPLGILLEGVNSYFVVKIVLLVMESVLS